MSMQFYFVLRIGEQQSGSEYQLTPDTKLHGVLSSLSGVSLSFEVGGYLQESSWAENYT